MVRGTACIWSLKRRCLSTAFTWRKAVFWRHRRRKLRLFFFYKQHILMRMWLYIGTAQRWVIRCISSSWGVGATSCFLGDSGGGNEGCSFEKQHIIEDDVAVYWHSTEMGYSAAFRAAGEWFRYLSSSEANDERDGLMLWTTDEVSEKRNSNDKEKRVVCCHSRDWPIESGNLWPLLRLTGYWRYRVTRILWWFTAIVPTWKAVCFKQVLAKERCCFGKQHVWQKRWLYFERALL